ncbi:uncharacterized protein LOC131605427 [Vicia villosa]|uniref:uncharacterized protein LOC131605427 n=1 Tax=Vicia villosa TaxID=3911 RepID=UPI00273CED3C|nr:uncharacterized protein LOC131605427 [Vicia villosa]
MGTRIQNSFMARRIKGDKTIRSGNLKMRMAIGGEVSSTVKEICEEFCSVVRGKLNSENVLWCSERFSKEEVKAALDQMNPLKAPGPGGLPALFYQKYWNIVGSDVSNLVLDILNANKSPALINSTQIVLIPKCKRPSGPKDFRPISLCNVVMKLVTKVIANRLKCILPEIVDEEQSAFVKGRLITDNVLVAMECFHWMKKKKKGKKGVMALKLDMSKAYDRVEWSFVIQVLVSMGFPDHLVNLIKSCISTVSYKVLINGQPSMSFLPERGLRQGDPLSPYLFILCTNVLSGWLKREVQGKKIHGIKVARTAPIISHLFFADDCLLFARANTSEAAKVLSILVDYEAASGQVVNLDKSEVSFSRNIKEEDKAAIQTRLNMNSVGGHGKYLGIPVVLGRSKREVFSLVVERVWKKMKGWKERFLSRAGKEVLIKAVAQAIPSYIMSCYKLPENVCNELESMLANFWWGSKEGKRKGEESLVGRVFKSRYFPNCSLADSSVGFCPSYAWRSIISARELVQRGTRWRIGNGDSVKVLSDNWLPNSSGFRVLGNARGVDQHTKVGDFIDRDLGCWDRDLVYSSFDPDVALQIISIPLAQRETQDKQIWHFDKSGDFTVKSAYHCCTKRNWAAKLGSSSSLHSRLWKETWKAPVHSRTRNFIWRLAKDILPVKTNLSKKGISLDTSCSLCNSAPETAHHVFMECPFAKQVFFSSSLGYRVPENTDTCVWIESILKCGDVLSSQILCTSLQKIWQARNVLLYERKTSSPVKIYRDAFDSVMEFNRENLVAGEKARLKVQQPFPSEPDKLTVVQCDAGVFPDNTVAFGCVFKDRDLECQFAASRKEVMAVPPDLAEVLALRWSLNLALSLGFDFVLLQSDAQTVVDCVNSSVENAVIEPIAADCRMLLSRFKLGSVMFISRTLNLDSHNIVGLGHAFGSRTWIGGLPDRNPVVMLPLSSAV